MNRTSYFYRRFYRWLLQLPLHIAAIPKNSSVIHTGISYGSRCPNCFLSLEKPCSLPSGMSIELAASAEGDFTDHRLFPPRLSNNFPSPQRFFTLSIASGLCSKEKPDLSHLSRSVPFRTKYFLFSFETIFINYPHPYFLRFFFFSILRLFIPFSSSELV